MRASREQTIWIFLGLLVLTMAVFTIVSPFNTAPWDDWENLLSGKNGQWVSVVHNRIVYIAEIIANFLMPGQAQGLQIVHMFNFWLIACVLVYLLRRLTNAPLWFATVLAAVYLLYLPYNQSHLKGIWNPLYTMTMAIAGFGAVFYLEAFFRGGGIRRVMYAVVAAGLSLLALRSFEPIMPLLVLVPIFLFLKERKFSRGYMAISGLWYAVIAFGFVQFLLPFLSGSVSESYQTRVASNTGSLSIGQIMGDTLLFFRQSFPVDALGNITRVNALLPSLLIAGLLVLVIWRVWDGEENEQVFPTVRELLMWLVVGLVVILFAASTYVYSGLIAPRAHTLSAPGEALVVLSLLGLLGHGLYRYLRVPYLYSLGGILLLVGVVGGHWYFVAQSELAGGWNFEIRSQKFWQILALVPDTKEDTLIIYDCLTSEFDLRQTDEYAIEYLYNGEHVNITSPDLVEFQEGGVIAQNRKIRFNPRPVEYGYDDLIMIGCEGNSLYILNDLPPALLPEGVDATAYDPYANILDGFVDPARTRIIAR